MDIVWLTSDRDNMTDHRELRYSMRSVDKHLKGVERAVIIGTLPAWAKDYWFIQMWDDQRNKEANIITKVLRACQEHELGYRFLLMFDDHFISRDMEARLWPNYYCGELQENSANVGYNARVRNTIRLLNKKRMKKLNFDCHTPMVIDRERFEGIMDYWPWQEKPGVVFKSLYANSATLPGTPIVDVKLARNESGPVPWLEKMVQAWPCFSTNSVVRPIVEMLWERLYPRKSRWEK